MNARSHAFEVTAEGQFVEDYVSAIFHTILLQRTSGKFHAKAANSNSYSIDTLHPEDVDCRFIEFTYARCMSEELTTQLKAEVAQFHKSIRSAENVNNSGQISLEFYQKKKNRWPFADECSTWEVWTIKFRLVESVNEAERQALQRELVQDLRSHVFYITEAVNVHTDYLPKTPKLTEMDTAYDLSFPSIQPYLFKISHCVDGESPVAMGTTVKKFFKDVAAF